MSAFEQAQADIKTLKSRPGNDDMLFLYAHYKQASAGNVDGKRPGMMDMVGRAKYDAWAKLEGMSQKDAEKAYVAKVNALLKG
jgi:acyl-CoA-binding protein